MLSPALSFLVEAEPGQSWSGTNPGKSHKDDEGIGACEQYREAERDGIVQPGEITAHRHLMHVYKYLVGVEVKNVDTESSERFRARSNKQYWNNEGINL